MTIYTNYTQIKPIKNPLKPMNTTRFHEKPITYPNYSEKPELLSPLAKTWVRRLRYDLLFFFLLVRRLKYNLLYYLINTFLFTRLKSMSSIYIACVCIREVGVLSVCLNIFFFFLE